MSMSRIRDLVFPLFLMLAACGGGGDGEASLALMAPASAQLTPQTTVVDLNVNGPAGQAYRLYQAAFGRVPDPEGLGFHIGAMQMGQNLASIAGNFLGSPEFEQRYGALSTNDFVTRLYLNVLGRAPDSAGLAFYVDNIGSARTSRAQVLVGFSESPENKQLTAAATAGGISYVPRRNTETSYKNYKEIGLQAQNFPAVTYAKALVARGYLNVDGRLIMFGADQRYLSSTSTRQTAPLSIFRFYTQNNGTWLEAPGYLPRGNVGCLNPRKALVADFNGDGRADVFVACTGYDGDPFPGERNRIVLSQPDGTYAISEPFSDIGFFHGAAAADFNNDGKIDVIVMSTQARPSAQIWLNRGDGTFSKMTGGLPAGLAKTGPRDFWNAVDLPDVNGDGFFDLFVGGPEARGGPPTVFLNPGNNDFSSAAAIALPVFADMPDVADIVATGSAANRRIWLLRSGGPSNRANGNSIQRIAWPSLASSIAYQRTTIDDVDWWILPMIRNGVNWIATDDASSRTGVVDE
jgi:hypothetical protein